MHSFLDCCLRLDQSVDFFNQVPQMFFRTPSLFSLPSHMLGFSTHWAASHTWAKAVSPKNHCWCPIKIALIDWSFKDELNLVYELEFFFESKFSSYIWSSIISWNEAQCSSHVWSWSSFWVPNVCQKHSTIKWPCTSSQVMLLA